jgi:hypothetical protein
VELNLLFDDIINLEKENFVNKSRRFCQGYDEISSKKRLIDEHEDESLIVYCYRHQVLIAFVRFGLSDKNLSIVSLQIKKGSEYIFHTLIKNTYNRLINLSFDTVEGYAYKSNHLAISLHIKLKLNHSQILEDRLGFIVSKEQFMRALSDYVAIH